MSSFDYMGVINAFIPAAFLLAGFLLGRYSKILLTVGRRRSDDDTTGGD